MKLRFAWLALLAVAGCGDNRANDPPPVLASPQIYVSVAEDGVATFDADAFDPDGEPVSYAATLPAHGTLTGHGPTYSYTPRKDFAGTDALVVSISDGTYTLALPVAITVAQVDDAPIAADLSAATNESQGVAVALSATDIDTMALTYAVVSPPQHGAVTGVPPDVMYTPTSHYFGPDAFTYRASDGTLSSNLATVTIGVADVLSCGDGVTEGAEQCDDGNAVNDDACLNNCTIAGG